MKNLVRKLFLNIVRQNDGYEFLFDDEVYLPVYKYALRITKRKIIKLNLVEEKVLEIIAAGVHQVDEIAEILGLKRSLLDVTLADLHTKDLIAVSSDICSLLKKGEQALTKLERVEKVQDIMKDVYIDALQGVVLDDISRYQMSEKVWGDDNKLQAVIYPEDIKPILNKFEDIQEKFLEEYSQTEISDGIKTESQELLTIDGIENVYVTFMKLPIQVFVSTNGLDIDVGVGKRKYSEVFSKYKDDIIQQINEKKVLKNHFRRRTIIDNYSSESLPEVENLFRALKNAYYNKKESSNDYEQLRKYIFSSRKLLPGEAKVILEYLAAEARDVEMQVDDIDDWAYDKTFVGSLSKYVAKAKLNIKYQRSKNITKAIEQMKKGHDISGYEQDAGNYFICWKYDEEYEIYAIPAERNVINDDTVCVMMDYYLHALK